MTAGWVLERLFQPFVKNGGLLDPNFGKIIFRKIFAHKEDNLGIVIVYKTWIRVGVCVCVRARVYVCLVFLESRRR